MTGPLHRLRPVDDDPMDVQRLLSSLPDPGPMPADLVDRIQASLSVEQTRRPHSGGATVYSLADSPTRRGPSTRFLVGMSGAAAAAALVGAVTVHGLTGQNDVAVLTALTSNLTGGELKDSDVAVEVSETKYDQAHLAEQASRTFAAPAKPLRPLGAESPAIGPLATPVGVQSCVSALNLTRVDKARVDLASFDGQPAAVLFTTSAAKTEVRVVNRACGGADSIVVNGPLSLP